MAKKSVKANAFLNAILQLTNIIFPLITFPYVSRILLVEANGRLSFCSSIVSYFTLFATLGLTTYGIKAVARVKDKRSDLSKTVHELLIINLVSTTIAFMTLVAFIIIIPRFTSEWILLIIYSINMLFNVTGLNWLYSGLEEYSYITKRSILFKILGILLMFIFVHSPDDYIKYAMITVFSTVGGNILNIIYARKFIDFKRYEKYNLKRHLKPTLAMFSTALATQVYSGLDSIMIGLMIGNYEVGIYTAAVRIRTILSTLVTSVGSVLLPRMSYLVAHDMWKEFEKMLKKSYATLLMISVPTATYFALEAEPSILFLSGDAYRASIVPMRILMPIIIISSLVNITGLQILIPIGGEWKYTRSVTLGALTDFLLNIFLIPKYGAIGAAIATLIAEFIEIIVQIYYTKAYLRSAVSFGVTIHVIVGTILGAIGCYVVKGCIHLNPFLNLVVTAFVFFSIYCFYLILVKYEMLYEVLDMLLRPFKTIFGGRDK